MAIDKRLKIYEAISGSTIHQSISTASSQAALSRCQANQVKDPSSALETLRNLIQPEINLRIQKILADIADSHIKPAIRNLRINLGDENVPSSVLEDMCVNALEAAKKIYMHNNATQHVTNNVTVNVKRQQPQLSSVNNNGVNTVNNVTKNANTTLISNTNTGILRGKCPNQVLKRSFSGSSHHSSSMPKKSMIIKSGLGRPNTDLILVNKAGRPADVKDQNGNRKDYRQILFLYLDPELTRLLDSGRLEVVFILNIPSYLNILVTKQIRNGWLKQI